MSRVCDIINDKSVQYGNKVSHSNIKTRRRFLPNLQNVTLISDKLNCSIKLKISTHTLRSIEANNGLDNFLLTTADNKLTNIARKLKRKVKKNLSSN